MFGKGLNARLKSLEKKVRVLENEQRLMFVNNGWHRYSCYSDVEPVSVIYAITTLLNDGKYKYVESKPAGIKK